MITAVELTCRLTAGPRPTALIVARGASGAVGLGEATPLPGRSTDVAGDAEAAVASLVRALPIALPLRGTVDAAAELAAAAAPTAPATRFAIETALLDLAARTTGRSLGRLLAARPALAVPLNALVSSVEDAEAAVGRGVACIKIKSHGAWPADRLRITAIRNAVDDTAVRVDANQTWPLDEAHHRLADLAKLGLEYVEEPSPGLAPRLRAPMACPLALDESLTDADLDAWLGAALASGAVVAVVLKPTLLGGLARCLALAARARVAGIDAVVTHAFEGPIATAAACELALALAPRRAVGLDRHVGLAPWTGIEVPHLAASVVIDQRRPGIGIEPEAVETAMARLMRRDDAAWLRAPQTRAAVAGAAATSAADAVDGERPRRGNLAETVDSEGTGGDR